MKKCKWCNTSIEDDVTICPHCKAEQSLFGNSAQTNHVEKFLEKHPNGKLNANRSTSHKKVNKPHNTDENYIKQIAEDIRLIKNIIVVATMLYVIGSLYIAINVLGL